MVIVGTLLNKDSHPIGSQPLELAQHRHSYMFLIGWWLFSLNQRNQESLPFTLWGSEFIKPAEDDIYSVPTSYHFPATLTKYRFIHTIYTYFTPNSISPSLLYLSLSQSSLQISALISQFIKQEERIICYLKLLGVLTADLSPSLFFPFSFKLRNSKYPHRNQKYFFSWKSIFVVSFSIIYT